MNRKSILRCVSVLLALAMTVGMASPMTTYATGIDQEAVVEKLQTDATSTDDSTDTEDESEEPVVTDYDTFYENLLVLEGYADEYVAANKKEDKVELVVNFIRTGVERYNDSNWVTLAGEAKTGFINYVAEQDATKGTNATILRNLEYFEIPNGQTVDFGHMFGALNIAIKAGSEHGADLGGWAGDLCDLLEYSVNEGVEGTTVDEKADYIREELLGVEAKSAFGQVDIYGDLDAYFIKKAVKEGKILSNIFSAYFTEEQNDTERAAYFLNNRFPGKLTNEEVRAAMYSEYSSNVGIQVLESDRYIDEEDELREAVCYAFADYLFGLADGYLVAPEDPEDPIEPEDPKEDEPVGDNEYYSVFSSTTTNLAPGIKQTIKYAYTADDKQIAYYIADVDINRDDVNVYANYKDNDGSVWGMSRVVDQMAAAQEKHSNPENAEYYVENYNTIVGVNADFYNMNNGAPSGALVMEGVEYNSANSRNFFGILKDGTPIIGTGSDYNKYKDQIQEAVGGSILLVKNGEMCVSSTDNYYTSRASRTCVGITKDNRVILMVLDGRQEPFSAGGTEQEIAQIMLDAGCVTALNLDGGGSTTFAAKQEGSDDVTVVNSPSDGYARSVSSSLVVVSTAVVSNEFDHANISTEADYLTIGTELELKAVGVSGSGNAADIPENAEWKVSDETIATVKDGVFTAIENGDVEVQLMVGDKVVGSKELHVVVPDSILFEKDELNVIFDIPSELPVIATYKGNPVKFNNNDIEFLLENDDAGYFEGRSFVATETTITTDSGAEAIIRNVLCVVCLKANDEIADSMKINMFREDEAMFDFDDITGGDRQLAWKREVSNSVITEDNVYQVVDPDEDMEVAYTFAIDMESIEIPEKLKDITYMLPGADDEDASAWGFLLDLAERVSTLTKVEVTIQFDEDVEVDYSDVKVVNEYFYKKDAVLDEETNTLVIHCGWHDQTAAIERETANPICILAGLKLKPKNNANWNEEDQIAVVNGGNLAYDIYLRANALYTFANNKGNQETYNLYPFVNEEVIVSGSPEKGAHFSEVYKEFEDSFVLDSTNRQGWVTFDDQLYYYVDNVAVTGYQTLPGADDAENEYLYFFNEDGSCNGKVTGIYEIDGHKYYAINGVKKTGWHVITDKGVSSYYYFDPKTGYALDGKQKIDGYNYIFEDYKLIRGELVKDSTGTRYMWAGQFSTQEWIEVDGKISYTKQNGYFRTGPAWLYSPEGDWLYFALDEDGIWHKGENGFFEYDGETYLMEDGYIISYPGVVYIDGYYYYFNSYDVMVKDGDYWVSKPNGLVPEARYDFDEQGRMVNPPSDEPVNPDEPVDPDAPVKNGIVSENGSLYYYENGKLTYAGLIIIDGNYYYVRTSGELAHSRNYWITKTNGLLPEGSYTFDETGKITNVPGQEPEVPDTPVEPDEPEVPDTPVEPDEPEVPDTPVEPDEPEVPDTPVEPDEPEVPAKNGIVEEDGKLVYYENDKITYAGLIIIDGNYYYVRTSGELVVDRAYWITKTNGLLPEKSYTFDAEGKIIDAPAIEPDEPADPDQPDKPVEVKDGIVAEYGSLYYYEDGVRVYAGLIIIDGNYYYVRTSGELAHNCKYWITKTNGLLPEKSYTFDAEGKITDAPAIKPDEPEVPDTPVVPDEPEVPDTPVEPDEPEVPDTPVEPDEPEVPDTPVEPDEPEVPAKNGIVEEDGKLYYYVDDELTYAGLIQDEEGNYYYVRSTGELVVDRAYWITKTNGLLPEKSYTFDAEGKMVNPPVIEPVDPDQPEEVKDGIVAEYGSLYYYEDGEKVYAGLIEVDGNYYYVRTSGELAHDCKYWITKTNGLMEEGSYTFDSEGKMVL